MNPGAVAMPFASVPTVTLVDPLEPKVPLAPLVGAVKVTEMPLSGTVSGQPWLSTTATCRFEPNGDPILAVCGLPETRRRSFGAFGVGHAEVVVGVVVSAVRAAAGTAA